MRATITPPDVNRQALWARLNGACEALWPILQPMLAQQPALGSLSLEVVDAIDSTNSELMRRARQGQTEPALLVALDQTAGRGRMGKSWHSTPGASLTFSIGLPLRPADWSGLSLAVGVSVAESLSALLDAHRQAGRASGPAITLKWPNDLWIDGHKLAGILVETALAGGSRYAVMGIGINIAPPAVSGLAQAATPSQTPANGHTLPPAPATGLAAHAPVDAADALTGLMPALMSDLLVFEQQGFAPFAQRFVARDALYRRPLVLSDSTHGTGDGVDASGALRVRTDAGVRLVTSAEVSVRPAPSPTQGGHGC
ncbi:MAG TPA: biotin--[acetyl-CoA-carboxylase] ligase [Burkholderiaceae bacterium]|nr:biotin--[acetyl-CoA-carboxylase] ligase [Burkholderiaceae bacterium]